MGLGYFSLTSQLELALHDLGRENRGKTGVKKGKSREKEKFFPNLTSCARSTQSGREKLRENRVKKGKFKG